MLRFEVVNSDHPLCSENAKDLNPYMRNFWKSRELQSADSAIIAYDDNQMIGFFRFDCQADQNQDYIFYGNGTYVNSNYRGRGIAKRMWEMALDFSNPKIVEVYCTSYGANKLIASIQSNEKYSKIDFCCFKYQ
jgi:predicted GNAT family acetyltransferase